MHGQTALVTGASRGIGKEIALELAREWLPCRREPLQRSGSDGGCDHGRNPRAASRTAFPVEADIRSSAQVTAMFERVIATFGRLDLLVNNAGVQTWKPLLEVTEEEWDLVVDTNLKGCFLCTQQAAHGYMKDHGGGSIVNLGSGCNKLAFPSLVAYTASKGGIEMFTKEAAVELGRYNIRVNCLLPGRSSPSAPGRRSRLRRHVVEADAVGPRGHGRRHRAHRGFSRQQRRIVHQRANHLDRRRAVHESAVAVQKANANMTRHLDAIQSQKWRARAPAAPLAAAFRG